MDADDQESALVPMCEAAIAAKPRVLTRLEKAAAQQDSLLGPLQGLTDYALADYGRRGNSHDADAVAQATNEHWGKPTVTADEVQSVIDACRGGEAVPAPVFSHVALRLLGALLKDADSTKWVEQIHTIESRVAARPEAVPTLEAQALPDRGGWTTPVGDPKWQYRDAAPRPKKRRRLAKRPPAHS